MLNTLIFHKIQCPECKHEFVYNPFTEYIIFRDPYVPFSPNVVCPKCHHLFSTREVKRTKPASIWELLRSKL